MSNRRDFLRKIGVLLSIAPFQSLAFNKGNHKGYEFFISWETKSLDNNQGLDPKDLENISSAIEAFKNRDSILKVAVQGDIYKKGSLLVYFKNKKECQKWDNYVKGPLINDTKIKGIHFSGHWINHDQARPRKEASFTTNNDGVVCFTPCHPFNGSATNLA